MYSQNDEEKWIVEFFDGFVGRFLDIGAYNGKVLSCSYRLVELGWRGVCVEPAPGPFSALFKLHENNSNIEVINCAVDSSSRLMPFFESNGDMVSTLDTAHRDLWIKGGGSTYRKMHLKTITMRELLVYVGYDFDFLKLDVEGINFKIFKTIPFERLENLKVLCVEHDNQQVKIVELASKFGFREISLNGENIIMVRK